MSWRYAAVNDAGRVIGSEHHNAKLSDDDIEMILALRDEGLSYAQIAAKFDDDIKVGKTMVCYICTGKRRRQTTMGHKRTYRLRFTPADLSDFD